MWVIAIIRRREKEIQNYLNEVEGSEYDVLSKVGSLKIMFLLLVLYEKVTKASNVSRVD